MTDVELVQGLGIDLDDELASQLLGHDSDEDEEDDEFREGFEGPDDEDDDDNNRHTDSTPRVSHNDFMQQTRVAAAQVSHQKKRKSAKETQECTERDWQVYLSLLSIRSDP